MKHIRISRSWLVLLSVASLLACGASADDPDTGFVQARSEMVRLQIEARGVTDSLVLKAMREVPRHEFVPEEYRHSAYADHPLPIGEGQTISQPYIVGLMTELLLLDGDEKILEIGTGSGYQAAVLGELAAEVYSIEIVEPLGKRSRTLLREMGYENITVIIGDGYQGLEEQAPFDAIIVTCAPPEIPRPLLDQLAEGGRMVIPVGKYFQELLLIQKYEGELTQTSIIPVRFVPMTGEGVDSL